MQFIIFIFPYTNLEQEFIFYYKSGLSDKELNNYAEKITSLFKQMYLKITLFKKILTEKIINKVIKIQSLYRSFKLRMLIKTNLLVNFLLSEREKNAFKLQNKYRNYFYIKEFNKILEKERNHFSVYFLMNASNRNIKLQIVVTNDKVVTYNFEFCKARNIYVAYIPKNAIAPLTYLCAFHVDGIPVLDSRYPTVYSGQSFYNKIDFSKLNKSSDSDDDDDDDLDMDVNSNNITFKNQSNFFNLKNIDHFRKKIQEDIQEEISQKSNGFFARNTKKNASNLSLNNLRKAEIRRSKKMQYVKSLSELLKREPLKPILKNGNANYRCNNESMDKCVNINSKVDNVSINNNCLTNSICSGNDLSIVKEISDSNYFNTKPKKRVTILYDCVDVYDMTTKCN